MRTYLDFAATCPMVPEVVEATAAELARVGNASSSHTSGRAARRVLEESREAIAAAVGAHPGEVIFTSGGTEADNIAVQGSWLARRHQRNRVVASTIEHPAVSESIAVLGMNGADVVRWPVGGDGVARLEALPELEQAAVVSLMWVNNETGICQPVPAMAARAREAGAWSHSDAVQGLGHLPIDFAGSGLDLMTITAHKIGGPIGIGALVARREVQPSPVLVGGRQERDVRSGTSAPALAAGFAAAVGVTIARAETERRRLAHLRRRLIDGVCAEIDAVVVNGSGETSPAIVNLGFAGARADDLLLLLDECGIDCSSGSACAAGVLRPSPVLLAMGRSVAEATSVLRFSFGWSTTEADIDTAIAALPEAVRRARLASGG